MTNWNKIKQNRTYWNKTTRRNRIKRNGTKIKFYQFGKEIRIDNSFVIPLRNGWHYTKPTTEQIIQFTGFLR